MPSTHPVNLLRWTLASVGMTLGCSLLLHSTAARAALTDLATAPLQTSTATLVKSNILFVLDDSGSMAWDYMPDWAFGATSTLARNAGYNGIYYDPSITYTPPLKYDGTSYPSMSASQTSNWTKVPYDGFGVQSYDSNNSFNWGSSANLTTGNAYYYTFIPGEYCTAPNLRTCATQAAASANYPYAATLRWCTNSNYNVCQAARIDTAPSNGSTYTYARYPGQTLSNNSTVPGSSKLVTISSNVTSYTYPGLTTKATSRTDCANSTCTYAEEMTNFANWWAYYHTRMQMTKSAASLSFVRLSNKYRLGYMSINNNTGSDFLNVADLEATPTSNGQKAKWYAKFIAAKPSNSTPLRVALSTAGRYYAGKLSTVNGQSAQDPVQYACQRNYTILSTDGYWNETTTPVQINGSTAIGDTDSASTIQRPFYDGTATGNTLADVAQYFYATDIRSTSYNNTNGALGSDVSSNNVADGQQRMYTSTVGLGASGYMLYQSNYQTAKTGDYADVLAGFATSTTTASQGRCIWQTSGSCNWPKAISGAQTTIDDLWHAAVNGRGNYYSAQNPADLQYGLSDFLLKVDSKVSDAAAATTSNPNVSTGDNYVFKSTFRSGDWYGEFARFTLDVNTGALSANADWSQSGTQPLNATTGTMTTPLLDNIAASSRNIYTYDPSKTTNTLLPFQWSSMSSTMQGYFKVAAISSMSQMCSTGSSCLPTASKVDSSTAGTTTGAGGINLVNYLRGDRSNEGTSLDNTTYYRQRAHVLGDIIDSQAMYVKGPQFAYTDTGYSEFALNNASRTGMVYVGANDGMVHAFRASDGAEIWAYAPSLVLPNMYTLADKNYSGSHANFVNATPRQGDVYYDDAWHTILVGGLGRGGRGYYALDISSTTTPKVLWEFTSDTSKGTGYTTDADLGYSYGQPLITKLSDGTWVVVVSSGYNNVSPGSGHGVLWVLNAKTGAIIKKLDNGMGSSSSTVSGCSAAPCPSGLSKISAYVESGATNNTALYIYGGDLYGNVWRFDMRNLTATGGSAPIQLLATLADSSGNRQPVTARAEIGKSGSSPVIYVGTGAYLGVSDVTSTGKQTIYALKDPLTTVSGNSGIYGSPRTATCASTATAGCFVQNVVTDSNGIRTATSSVGYSVDFATMGGWYEDLPESGERMNTDPDLQLGTLAFTSNVPSSSDACSVGGSSYLNYLDYRTGLAVPGSTQTGVLLSNGTTTALASAVTLVRLPNGKVVAVTNLSDGSSVVNGTPVNPTNLITRRVSWRELITND
jgi:type IV pilus assembly protein PilY1